MTEPVRGGVSVTIPCYNGAAYLADTIESALAQSTPVLEILVLDDGSTDDSASIVQGFGDPRVRYVRQSNHGLAHTRNRLTELSRGEYVAFLDQDDLWSPDRLEKQLALFARKPALTLAYGDCAIIDARGGHVGRWSQRNSFHRGRVFDALVRNNFIPLPTVLIRREALQTYGPFRPYKVSEEYDLFLRCAAEREVDYVPDVVASYRIHPGQFSAHFEMELAECLSIYSEWMTADRSRGGCFRRAIARSYYNAAKNTIYREGDGLKARGYLMRSLQSWPLGCAIAFYPLTFLGRRIVKSIRKAAVRMLGSYSLSE